MSSEPTSGGERGAIARRAGIVALGTLGSRILGAARDAVIAATFAVAATDAFFVAFTIPNALRVLLGEGAVSGAFVPVYAEVRAKEGAERARVFFARLVGAMSIVLTLVSIGGVLAAPWLVELYAAGYEGERLETTVLLTRIVFPYILFMGLAALATGALQSEKRFLVPAFAPALLNVALIAAPFALVPVALAWGLPVIGSLAIGALIGGVLQLLAQLSALRGIGLLLRPRLALSDPYVRKAFRLLVPLLAGLGVYQLNVMLSRLFASFLPEGSQSFLYYGQRLVEIPQGMFAFAIASAALPTLADMRSRGMEDEVRRTFGYGLRLSLFVAIPSTVALVVLAEPTCTVLFGRGTFDATYVSETARSLAYQAAGIWAVASVRTVVPMFHAYNDTRSPVLGSAANLVVFTGLSFALMGPMQHAGIAVAISGAAVAQLGALLYLLRLRVGRLGLRDVVKSAARMIAASAAMGAVLFGVARVGAWERGGNDLRNVAVLLAALVAGALAYLLAARLLRAPELTDVLAAVRRRARPRAS
jgi:putative peptidoglycan lipid II flippase